MSLGPPDDFRPPLAHASRPSLAELEASWRRGEERRRERERRGEWGALRESVRRSPSGDVVAAAAGSEVPVYVADRLALGPEARARLRPVAQVGRVLAAGIDSWSVCWYAEPGDDLSRAMRGMSQVRSGHAWLLSEPLGSYRVGWFEESGLVFAEGRPAGAALCGASRADEAIDDLVELMGVRGIPVRVGDCAGLRRLDVAVDIATDSALEGLALLECLARLGPVGAVKAAAFRGQGRLESVVLRTRGGRTLARVYDKGVETGFAAPGEWLRFEAQWRFPRSARPPASGLGPGDLRERFARRFRPFWQGAEGVRVGGLETLSGRLQEAIREGRLAPSRARSIAGYLVLSAAGVDQGARRTVSELEREARELGLSAEVLGGEDRFIDVATVLDECLVGEIWG